MSKGLGQKIAIQFSEKLIGDVSGFEPVPVAIGDYYRPIGTYSVSNSYSAAYNETKPFDGSTSTYWQTRLTGDQWVQVQLSEPTWIKGFRWYIGSSYRPNAFIFQGSDDGVNWDDIYTGSSDNTTGWKGFELSQHVRYQYYRWTITSRYSTYIDIYEIELLVSVGNEKAFTISGLEKIHVDAEPITPIIYKVTDVERHPTILDEKTLLLTLHPQGRFNDVEGNLTISYDSTKGNLQGRGGFVESFTQQFLPTDLTPFPNPHADEIITVNPNTNVVFTKIDYENRYAEETITVTSNTTVVLTYVGTVNP